MIKDYVLMNENDNNFDNLDKNRTNFILFYSRSLDILEKYRNLNVILTTVCIVIGLIGHFLTIFVFLQKRFRKNSSNVYMLFLAINDSLYLITHFFEDTIRTYIYINETELSESIKALNIMDKNQLACKLLNYLRCVLRFISAYIIVAFSLQRLNSVYSPFSNKFKSTKSAWLTVTVISVVSLLINSWVPYLFVIHTKNDVNSCDVKTEWSKEYFHLTLIYIYLIMLIPIIILIISSVLIILNLVKERPRRCYSVKKPRENSGKKSEKRLQYECIHTRRMSKMKPIYLTINQIIQRASVKANSTRKITQILMLISFSYAFLSLPYFLSWSFYYFELTFYHENDIELNYLYAAVEISEIFYILNYSIYFYIYLASGSVFRNQLRYSTYRSKFNRNSKYFKVEYYEEKL